MVKNRQVLQDHYSSIVSLRDNALRWKRMFDSIWKELAGDGEREKDMPSLFRLGFC